MWRLVWACETDRQSILGREQRLPQELFQSQKSIGRESMAPNPKLTFPFGTFLGILIRRRILLARLGTGRQWIALDGFLKGVTCIPIQNKSGMLLKAILVGAALKAVSIAAGARALVPYL